tara:strand:- start:698 stop:847 length:150 start_codon:yes stop_codon:yes gene_type:complete
VENEYRIECEECDTLSIVLLDNGTKPEFCPVCGRRASAEDITDGDWQDI